MPSGTPARFPVRSQPFTRERILSEGVPYFDGGSASAFWSATGGIGLAVGALNIGNTLRGAWVDAITITSNIPCVIQTLGPYMLYGGLGSVQYCQYVVGPSGVSIPVNSFYGPDLRNSVLFSLMSVPSQNPYLFRATASNSGGTALAAYKGYAQDNGNSTFYYDLTIANSSGSTASGTTTVTDTLPSDCTVISTTGTGWTISVSGNVLTATSSSSVANGSSFPVIRVTLQAKTAVNLAWSVHGWSTDCDTVADLTPIVWCGTSITQTGGSSYAVSYPYLMRNWFRDTKGINTRVVNKAISGSHSSHHEYLRAFNGRYTLNEAPFAVFWEHGINDVSQSVATATTQANLTAWLKYWNTFYPNTWCVVLSPFPNGNATNEAKLVTLRSALATTMSTVGGAKNILVSGTGSMFNPSTQSVTYTTDLTHLNDAGCALAASTIQSALASYF